MNMCRLSIFAAFLVAVNLASLRAADEPKDKKAELKKAVEKADLVLVGKVTKTGLVAASSFDVGLIEASKVLKGDDKIKSVKFRYSGRVVPSYAKVGVEGVWVLSKADNKPGWRSVLSFQPLDQEKPVRALIKKAVIVLPKDPKAVVLSYDPGAGGFIRKGAPPYLKIQADGKVTVTNLVDGSEKESKLTAKKLEELLRYVIWEKDLLEVTAAGIDAGIKKAAKDGPFIAIGGAGTSVIAVQTDGKKHEVKYRGAGAYLSTYPAVEMLAQFVAVEKRLSELADSVAKGK
jgi:hypothetical protein